MRASASACTLFSCSNVEKKPVKGSRQPAKRFERGDYSEAKMQIDSIKILYPKAFETRREGIGLMQQVELKEQEKTLVYLDSMLQEKQEEVDAIKGNYAFRERCRVPEDRQLPASFASDRKEPAPLLPALSGGRERRHEHDLHLLRPAQHPPPSSEGHRPRRQLCRNSGFQRQL